MFVGRTIELDESVPNFVGDTGEPSAWRTRTLGEEDASGAPLGVPYGYRTRDKALRDGRMVACRCFGRGGSQWQ